MMKTGYTDIHTHILPGVDDGASSIEESLKMLEIAVKEGTQRVILTPHYIPGNKKYEKKNVEEIFENFKRTVKEHQIPIELELGNELYYRDGIIEALQSGAARTMAGTQYVLVEFGVKRDYDYIYQSLKRLQEYGYRPILAHVERYDCLHKKKDLIEELIKTGFYIQMNTEELMAGLFSRNKSFCTKLFLEGYIHFLGSDCHDTDVRAPYMKKAIDYLSQKAADGLMEEVLYLNPEKLLKNEYL